MTTISMHFIMTGEFFTKKIQRFVIEHRMSSAHKFLDGLRPNPTIEAREKIIHGDAKFIGATLCDKPECDQCKDLRDTEGDFRYVAEPDLEYKKELKNHKKYMAKYTFEIDGDTTISKKVITDIFIAQADVDKLKKYRYDSNDYDKLNDRDIRKSYVEALDQLEFALDYLYRDYGINRQTDYEIGSRDWQTKLDVDSLLDVIKVQANSNDEIKKLISDAKEIGWLSANATEMMYQQVMRGKELQENQESTAVERFTKQAEIKEITSKPKKPSKETILVGGLKVPKNLLEDYANCIKTSNFHTMMMESRTGVNDPLEHLKRLELRVEYHKRIFKALKLPYHQEIGYKKKLTTKQKQSMKFAGALNTYIEEDFEASQK